MVMVVGALTDLDSDPYRISYISHWCNCGDDYTMKTTVIYDPIPTPVETITCKIELVLTRGTNEIETPTGQVGLAQLCMHIHDGIVQAVQENYDATIITSLQTKAELLS